MPDRSGSSYLLKNADRRENRKCACRSASFLSRGRETFAKRALKSTPEYSQRVKRAFTRIERACKEAHSNFKMEQNCRAFRLLPSRKKVKAQAEAEEEFEDEELGGGMARPCVFDAAYVLVRDAAKLSEQSRSRLASALCSAAQRAAAHAALRPGSSGEGAVLRRARDAYVRGCYLAHCAVLAADSCCFSEKRKAKDKPTAKKKKKKRGDCSEEDDDESSSKNEGALWLNERCAALGAFLGALERVDAEWLWPLSGVD